MNVIKKDYNLDETKRLIDIMVEVIFQNIFYLKINQNNIFLFLKIYFG
jgi:hypothetical protein